MGFYTPPIQTGSADLAVNVNNVSNDLNDAMAAQFQRSAELEGVSSAFASYQVGNLNEQVLRPEFDNEILLNDIKTIARFNPIFGVADYIREVVSPSFIEKVRDGQIDFLDPRYRSMARRNVEFMSADQANAEGERWGATDFNQTVSRSTFNFIVARQIDRNKLDSRINRVREEFGSSTMLFASALAGAAIDPLNVASAFIPVMGQAKWARMVRSSVGDGMMTKVLASKAVSRFSTGAINAFVGNLAIEPIIYQNQQSFQGDYTTTDSLVNLTFGSLVGGGLHLGIGAIKDISGKFTSHNRMDNEPLSQNPVNVKQTAPLLLTDGRVADNLDVRIIEAELNHGFGRQMSENATPAERNAFMALAVNNLVEGKLPNLDGLVELSSGIKNPKIIDIDDMPLDIKVITLPDGRIQISFKKQHDDVFVSSQIGDNFDDAASKLIGTFIHKKRLKNQPVRLVPTEWKKVAGVTTSGQWTITKVGKAWEVVDASGSVLGTFKTLKAAKEANKFLPENKFDGSPEDLAVKQKEQGTRLDSEKKLQGFAKKIEELNSPATFKAKLVDLGYPIHQFDKMDAGLAFRKTEGRQDLINRAEKGKGKKRLRLYDEETKALEQNLKLQKQLADQGRFERAKSQIRAEKEALIREAKKIQRALGKDVDTPQPITPNDLEAQARQINETKTWLEDKQVALDVADTLKLPEKFLVKESRLVDTKINGKATDRVRVESELTPLMEEFVKDIADTMRDINTMRAVSDISDQDFAVIEKIAMGDNPRITTNAPLVKTSTAQVNSTVISSFDNATLSSIAKEAGFEDMADFRSKVMANPDSFREMELNSKLQVAIKDTLDRQEAVRDAMDRGAKENDLIEAGLRGDDLSKKIPQNEYDVEISKTKAMKQILADYVKCRTS